MLDTYRAATVAYQPSQLFIS